MNILEIPFLEALLDHIKTYFKINVSIYNNSLLTTNSAARDFFNCFTIKNIKLELKICNSLRSLFERNDFKLYFQAKNRVLINLVENVLYVEGYKTYAEMTFNNLLSYYNWDKIAFSNTLTDEEHNELKQHCSKEFIELDDTLSKPALNLLLNMLERYDGIEVVSVSSQPINRPSITCKKNKIIDLSKDDDDDLQFIDLTYRNSGNISLQKEIKPTSSVESNESKPLSTHNDLRPIILDGNNIAFSHGCGNFNPLGIHIAVNYFLKLGHHIVYALIPRHRQVDGGEIFEKLEKSKNLIYTPSRVVNNKRETSYDDKMILDAALGHDGVVISNDQYRDLIHITKYKDIIINKLIPYAFVGDLFMIPDDPRGQLGPHLSTMLSFNSPEPKVCQTIRVKKNRRNHSIRKLTRLKRLGELYKIKRLLSKYQNVLKKTSK